MSETQRNLVAVFNPETEWQGDLIVQELKAAGFDAYLANRATVGVWGGLGPLADRLEILVPEDKQAEARELIENFLAEHVTPVSEEALAQEAQEATPPDDLPGPDEEDKAHE